MSLCLSKIRCGDWSRRLIMIPLSTRLQGILTQNQCCPLDDHFHTEPTSIEVSTKSDRLAEDMASGTPRSHICIEDIVGGAPLRTGTQALFDVRECSARIRMSRPATRFFLMAIGSPASCAKETSG